MLLIPGLYALSTFLYCLFIGRIKKAWSRLLQRESGKPLPALPRVSVIVPVRNEAASIGALVKDLLTQDYPPDRWELIFVNDGSTDGSEQTIADLISTTTVRVSLLHTQEGLSGSKKLAVAHAIECATGDWVLTTDGDCRVGASWVSAMARAMRPEAVLVAGPVRMQSATTYLGRLQAAEWIGLQCIGAAGIFRRRYFFCNGANLAYRKSAFLETGGFSDKKNRLSGDDTDLLLRFRNRWPEGIRFQAEQDAVVQTDAASGIGPAFSQRHRWASKIPVSLTAYTLSVAFTAWLAHVSLLVVLAFLPAHPRWLVLVLPVFFLKAVSEYVLLKDGASYFRQQVSLSLILSAQLFYSLYITLVGFAAVLLPYTWKGRKGT